MKRKLISILLMVSMLLSIFAITATQGAASGNAYRCGDVNGDGIITITDALEVLKYLAGLDNVMTNANRQVINQSAFDASRLLRGAAPTINDVLEILKKLAGLSNVIDTINCASCNWCAPGKGGATTTAPTTTPNPGGARPNPVPPAINYADLTAHQLVSWMRAGWNLGNTFDWHDRARGYDALTAPLGRLEMGWLGFTENNHNTQNQTERSLFFRIRDLGFDTVRIPVTWYKAADRNNNWTIRPDFMNRVKQVVDWAIEADLYVILNTHHEEFFPNAHNPSNTTFTAGGFSLYDRHMEQSQVFVRRLWEQICATFNNSYDHRLIFEVLNEPRAVGGPQEWTGGTPEERLNLNTLNQLAVDTIRSTGGRNLHRILMVPTYAASPAAAAFSSNREGEFVIPNDPLSGPANKIALSLHMYFPENFCFINRNSSNPTEEFGQSGRTLIENNMGRLARESERLQVPIIMGEWGSVNKTNTSHRAAHAEFYAATARQHGIATVWWDNGSSADGRHGNIDGFGLIRRPSPHAPMAESNAADARTFQEIIDAILRGAGPHPQRRIVNFNSGGGTDTTPTTTTAGTPPTTTTSGQTPTATTTTATNVTPPTVTTPTDGGTQTTTTITTGGPTVTATTVTTPNLVGGVLFNMQTAEDLQRMASGGGNIPMLQGAGGGNSQRTVSLDTNPRTINIINRAGAPASGIDIRLANLTTRANHSYRFEITGRLGTAAGAEMRLMLAEAPMTELINPRPATTANGVFSMTYTASHDEIRAFLAGNPEQRFRIRSNESTDDLIITGIVITEIPQGTGTVATTTTAVSPPTATTTTSTNSGGNAIQNMSAHQVVQNMGVGWNLGNTFDAVTGEDGGLFTWGGMNVMNAQTIPGIETAWLGGVSHITTQAFINSVKAAGFDTIRIPVTWWKATNANRHNLAANTYQINPLWMARVKEVVDWAIAADMYVILNTHHEEDVMPMGAAGRAQAVRFVDTVWRQIAREFRGYDHRLVFEGLNEPREKGGEGEWWGGNATSRESLNQMNAAFVRAVREDGAQSGGNNNRWRILMVPTYAAGAQRDSPVFSGFVIPDDPTSGSVNKMILSIHTYSPFGWAHDGICVYGCSGGSRIVVINNENVRVCNTNNTHHCDGNQTLARTRSDLDFVRTNAIRLGTPVVLGEWGSVNASLLAQRNQHAEDYVREARARGMATVYWDNNATSTTIRDHGFGILDRRNPGTPRFPTIVAAIMRGKNAPFTPQPQS
jgi:endoglucanase